jgi:hypothetical protein
MVEPYLYVILIYHAQKLSDLTYNTNFGNAVPEYQVIPVTGLKILGVVNSLFRPRPPAFHGRILCVLAIIIILLH